MRGRKVAEDRNQNNGSGEESWIWGNSRGGGGAPLKDQRGAVVTNLRDVIRGSIEVDTLSPSERRKQKSTYETDDAYYNNRWDDRRRDAADESNEYDDRREMRQRGKDRERGVDSDYDKPTRSQATNLNTSPKKFMSSLREMNGNTDDRALKLQKEREYQAQLRSQIEEKNKQKEIEKLKEEESTKRELIEYKRLQSNGRSGAGEDIENDNYGTNGRRRDRDFGGPSLQHDNINRRNKNVESEEYDWNGNSRRQRNKEDSSSSTTNNKRNYIDDDNNGRDRQKDRDSNRGYRSDASDDGYTRDRSRQIQNVVSKDEYDELSALCERLLSQQDNLRDEIDRQARMIEELKQTNKPINLPRAKSMQQNGRPAEKPVTNRPHSTRSANVSKDDKIAKPKPKPKVAFGQPIKESVSKLAEKGRDVVEANVGKPPKGRDVPNTGKKGLPNIRLSNEPDSRFKRDASPVRGARGEGGGGGFSKLQSLAKAGPVVVTYEEETSKRNSNSFELNGESEYLRVGNANSDYIGGDQLDKLLVQARRARAAI